MLKTLFSMCLFACTLGTTVLGADVEKWKEKLAASEKAWEAARQTCEGNYSYEVRVEFYSGSAYITTIVVRDNKVVERKLVKGMIPRGKPSGSKLINTTTEWTETTADLGKHEGYAAKPKTLDELYAEAHKLLNGPIPNHEQLTVSFDNDGLLAECYTVDTRLADDNPRKGVALSKVSLSKK